MSTGLPNVEWSIIVGQGSWKNSNTEVNPTYLPAGNDYNTGITLLLTAYGEGDCGFVETQEININFEPEIIVNAGTGGTICKGKISKLMVPQILPQDFNQNPIVPFIWTTSGDGFFNNPTGEINPIYTPGPLDNQNGYLTPVTLTLTAFGTETCPGDSSDFNGDGINDYSQDIQLLVEPSISVFAGNDVTICTDNTQYDILDAFTNKTDPVVTWTTLGGSQAGFVDPTNVNTSYFPQQEDYDRGYVTLVLRGAGSGNCTNSIEDTMTIFFSEAIDAYAGPVESVCYPDSYVFPSEGDKAPKIYSSTNSYSSYYWEILDGDGTY